MSGRSLDPADPLSPPEARRCIRHILDHGSVLFLPHAKREMAKDELEAADCINVLRAGVVDPPEQHGETLTWRYRVHTALIWVVIEFESETRLFVITAWRS